MANKTNESAFQSDMINQLVANGWLLVCRMGKGALSRAHHFMK
jgi:hypothetical protein